MSTFEEDLVQLNFEYLILARDAIRSNPLEAAWRFGLTQNQISMMETLTVEKIKNLACTSRAVVNLLPLQTPINMAPSLYGALLIHTGYTEL